MNGRIKLSSFIEIKDLNKQYMSAAEVPILALRNLNLEVAENEIVTIMGPSGCGKTTLLTMLGGIASPTSGFIRVGNYYLTSPEMMSRIFSSATHTEYRQKSVGFIFQLHNLSPIHTALENVELPLIFASVPREVRKKRAKELLEQVGLANRITHRPDALSGGERQRVAVATAFANNPSLILADEPTGELDSENSRMICELFLELKKRNNFTMILVTHDPKVAAIGDRVLEMRDGAIRGEIPKETVRTLTPSSQESKESSRQFPFPPKFCGACGSNSIILPKTETRSGFWTEASGKRIYYELRFAQCVQCGQVFWQPTNIDIES
ncbi:MAG: ABC transporter ATP-binding protein [Candidatus Heimdallarchaeota archaeon]|nr:ABC transporter ATP-binding protein [Candidatus Heimdallarchaeota archaeon]